MEQNGFELTGRISFIDMKYLETGTIICRALMSKKDKKSDEYDTYPITFFSKTAEDFGENVHKGDTVNVTGKISVNKYEKDGKKYEKLELLGFGYTKAKWDDGKKQYVEDTTKAETKTTTSAKAEKDAPWE